MALQFKQHQQAYQYHHQNQNQSNFIQTLRNTHTKESKNPQTMISKWTVISSQSFHNGQNITQMLARQNIGACGMVRGASSVCMSFQGLNLQTASIICTLTLT
eukprot:5055669-Amphidinium_carterae.1